MKAFVEQRKKIKKVSSTQVNKFGLSFRSDAFNIIHLTLSYIRLIF